MYHLKYTTRIPLSLEKSWDFFSSPKNLKILTPEFMRFDIITEEISDKMYPGQIIGYKVCPIWDIPITWFTEITHVNEPHYFVDEQRIGPYKIWHHQHHFKLIPNGVEMTDLIYYQMPFGILGKALNAIKIRKDLEAIFSFRKAKLVELFGPFESDKKTSTETF